MDRINEMLTRLSELSEGEMSDLEGSILSEFKSVEQQEPTAEIVEAMTALADALDAVRGEQTSRAALQQELAAKAAEAAARIQESNQLLEDKLPEKDVTDEETPEEEIAPDEEEEPKPEDILLSAKAEPAAELSSEAPKAAEVVEQAPEPAPVAAEAAVEPAPEPEPVAVVEPEPAAAVAATEEPAVPAAPEEASTSSDPVQTATPIEENPVAASATDVVVKPPAEAQVTTLPRQLVSVTAGADIPGKSAGSDFSDLGDVSNAFVDRLHALRRVTGGDGEQHIVASIHADYPEDRTLYAGQGGDNWEKIRKITSREALVAAITCYPLETKFNLFGVGSADRPVRDSLAVFNADRGGLRFYSAPTLGAIPSDGTGPLGIWKQDKSVTSVAGASLSGVKPCYTVVCSDEKTALLEAVSLCLTFNNLMTRASPEVVARHNELALIFQARATEIATLAKIKAGGTAVTAKNYNVGAAREFFAQVDGIAAAYRYKYRLGARDPLRAIAPLWFRDMLRADIAQQMPGDGLDSLSVSQSIIDGWFRERNINVTWSLDSLASSPAPAIATGAFGTTVEWDLFAEGTWLYLDGGTLDIGVIRDSTLVGTNDYKTFTEEFNAVALIGDESLHVTSTVVAAGAAAALEDNFS